MISLRNRQARLSGSSLKSYMEDRFKEKYDRALTELKARGLSQHFAFNMGVLFLFLKIVGFRIRPPYYNSLLVNTIVISVFGFLFFTIFLGFSTDWNFREVPVPFLLSALVIMPTLLGFCMAKIYEVKAVRKKLSDWESL